MPNRGAFVRNLDLLEIEHLFEAFSISLRLAALYCDLRDPELARDVSEMLRQHRLAVKEGRYLDVTYWFSTARIRIARACENGYIADFCEHILTQMRRLNYYVYRIESRDARFRAQQLQVARRLHGELIAALKAGNNEALANLMERHVGIFRDRVGRALGQSGVGQIERRTEFRRPRHASQLLIAGNSKRAPNPRADASGGKSFDVAARLELLDLASRLGNVSQACDMMGVSRDTFYRYKKIYERTGEAGLRGQSRHKPNLRNQVPQQVETAVVELSVSHPSWGQAKIARALGEKGVTISPLGVRGILLRHDLAESGKRLTRRAAKQRGPDGAN